MKKYRKVMPIATELGYSVNILTGNLVEVRFNAGDWKGEEQGTSNKERATSNKEYTMHAGY